jgi:hypothetical protein
MVDRWDVPSLARVLEMAIVEGHRAARVEGVDRTPIDRVHLAVLLAAARTVLERMVPPELTPEQAKFKAILEELRNPVVRRGRTGGLSSSSWSWD